MSDRQSLRFIAYCLRAFPRHTAIMVILLILSGLAEGIGLATLLPLLELAVGDTARSGLSQAISGALGWIGLQPTLGVLLGLIVAGMSLKAAFLWLAMRQVGYTVARVGTDLRLHLIGAVLQARWSYFADQPAGHFANAIGMEAYRASAAYREACAALAGGIQVLVYLVVAFLIAWQVALMALLGGGFFLLALSGLVRMSWGAGKQQTERMIALITQLTDAVHGLKPIKAMAREPQLWRLLKREAEAVNASQQRQVLASETLRLLQEPLLALMVAIGLYMLMSVGNQPFAAVLVMAFLFYRLMGQVHLLQGHYQSMATGESAFWSLRKSIEGAERAREHSGGEQTPPPLAEGIAVESICFSHGERQVLRDVSLFIPAGALVALVGPSGAGKTTLADLVAGLYRPLSGEVYVDGVPLAVLDLGAWRRGVGYVPQETFLFHDTIFGNVALRDEEISREAVEGALTEAGAWRFVAERPEGIDALVGERGSKFSGGQAQRVALARALVRKPRLLVLDEVTTGLDPETEAGIFETLRELRGKVTILFISHRPTVVEAADVVFRIDNGMAMQLKNTMILPASKDTGIGLPSH